MFNHNYWAQLGMQLVVNKVCEYIPDQININLVPIKNYLTGNKKQHYMPKKSDVVNSKPGLAMRKQVMTFENPWYNRFQDY